MLSGIGHNTPLGQIVSIRAENDPEVLKTFNREQKRIRSEYQKKIAKDKSAEEVNNAIESFRQAFIKLAGGDIHEET